MASARSHPPFPPGFRLVPPGGNVLPPVVAPDASTPAVTPNPTTTPAAAPSPGRAAPVRHGTHRPASHPRSRPRPQRLWLAVHLPGFAGEVGLAGVPADHPAVLVTPTARNPRVCVANEAARVAGIGAGASIALAQALAGSRLVVHTRDVSAEASVLAALGDLAWRWTPVVALLPPDGLWLEVRGSLGLFGGLAALKREVRAAFAAAGHTVVLASAPTAQAARLLSLAGVEADVEADDASLRALRPLPLARLRLPVSLERLEGMGLRQFGQLLRLPRAGLAERFGPAFIDWLDRALGSRSDTLPLHAPAEHYRQRLDLLEEIHALPRLQALAERQLAGLCGWLAARGLGLLSAQWLLSHAGDAVTAVRLGLLEPSRDPLRLARLLQERWNDLRLPGPVRALTLELLQATAFDGREQSLLRGSGGAGQASAAGLVELLRARLGEEAVRGLVLAGEHRPERAWQLAEPGPAADAGDARLPPRPLWLLPEPRALECREGLPWLDGALFLVGAAERIESGWWDGVDVARDYHTAERADGLSCWLYRDLRSPAQWYLHGLFA